MDKSLKLKSLWYLLISALSFSYLILRQDAGVSVTIFIILQFVCLWFLAPKKKPLLMFIPVFILSLNSFISASRIWSIPNFFAVIFLYSVMALWMTDQIDIKLASSRFVTKVLKNSFEPLRHFNVPVKWCNEINKLSATKSRRILFGVAISLPCLLFLLVMLSFADQIFSQYISHFFNITLANINFTLIFKILAGAAVGLYLFGMIYSVHNPKEEKASEIKPKNGDLIVLGMLLGSVIVIYTVFAVIQFKYLFASASNLPYGLTYTSYARQGFFELLFLSGLNILLILITVGLTKEKTGKWVKLIKWACCYLCAITLMLLASSFYRMHLYSSDFGLTRLRLLVFGFLVFEAIGLIITFFYILKPKFSITAVYSIIALIYYLILNIVPMDAIIAKNQIDKHFEANQAGFEYVLMLSIDAAPQIARLLESPDENIRQSASDYFKYNTEYYINHHTDWRQWNLSVQKFRVYEIKLN